MHKEMTPLTVISKKKSSGTVLSVTDATLEPRNGLIFRLMLLKWLEYKGWNTEVGIQRLEYRGCKTEVGILGQGYWGANVQGWGNYNTDNLKFMEQQAWYEDMEIERLLTIYAGGSLDLTNIPLANGCSEERSTKHHLHNLLMIQPQNILSHFISQRIVLLGTFLHFNTGYTDSFLILYMMSKTSGNGITRGQNDLTHKRPASDFSRTGSPV
ncbi:hypothetical protein BZA77DRAFT_368622 [Pyronema omphalodes]|nr:hypothetical protein BZA77DRAFT_368622 [Pyronema omphalodes]